MRCAGTCRNRPGIYVLSQMQTSFSWHQSKYWDFFLKIYIFFYWIFLLLLLFFFFLNKIIFWSTRCDCSEAGRFLYLYMHQAILSENWHWSVVCFLSSINDLGEEDDSPETKVERERLRRQANNARERFVVLLSVNI